MPHWMLKAGLHRAIGTLPKRHRWNEWLQQHVTQSLDLTDAAFEGKLRHCRRHLDHLQANRPAGAFSAFDLGTGWFPVVPVGLYLCGAERVWTCDITPLLRTGRVRRMLERCVEYAADGRLRAYLPTARPDRVTTIQETLALPPDTPPEGLLRRLGIDVMVGDASRVQLPPASVDLIESTEVLEYVPPGTLGDLLRAFARWLRPDGRMSHLIDLQDEYSYFDRRLSPLNFLRYSDRTWRWVQSPFTPLNRIRIDEYRDLFETAGFTVVAEDNRRCPAPELDRVPLHERFRSQDPHDLLILQSWIMATR